MSKPLSFSGTLVREHDPDRFYLSLLTPGAGVLAPAMWPLLAFNYEISRTREVVTDTTIGLIRLQWWRDALDQIYQGGAVPKNDVVQELAETIDKYQLPKDHFDALIYAREFDLEDVLPASLEGLVNYADFTHTPLLKLCLMIGGEQEDCRDIAVAYVLVGLLRSLLFHARQLRCYLPADLVEQGGVNLKSLYDLKPDAALPAVVKIIADLAQKHLAEKRPHHKLLRGMRAATELYLGRIKACQYDPYHPSWLRPPAFKELRVVWAVL